MNVLFWIGAAIIVAFVFYVQGGQKQDAINQIKRYIQRNGGSEIGIGRVTWANSMSMPVTYRDRQGRHHGTSAMVNYQWLSRSQPHWTADPVTVLNPPWPGKNGRVDSLGVDSQRHSETAFEQPLFVSSKEQIIADLTADNQRLQEKVAALQKQLKNDVKPL